MIIIASFLILTASSTTFESQPNATDGLDSYIRENLDSNFGTSTILRVGKVSIGLDNKALIAFNISEINSTSTITSAKIQVYVNVSSGVSNRTINIYRVTSNWSESETTWNNATSISLWNSFGGDYAELIDSIVFTNSSGIYYNFTITSLARSWLNGTYNNFGIVLLSNNSQPGNNTDIASSDNTAPEQRPKIIIDYTSNAPPTIDDFSSSSSLTNPKEIGEQVMFSVNWTDLEANSARLFVCNSSNISYFGCIERSFCNTSLQAFGPSSCSYTVLSSDNRTTKYFVGMCDSGSLNCSQPNQSYFYMNHFPNITLIQPNGGENINQSQGNYTIKFNVSDADSDLLKANIYYGLAQNSTTNLIASNLNLTAYCTDSDSRTNTTNNCSYSWNSSGIYGIYFMTIILNDSFSLFNDSSSSAFNVTSIADNLAPNITSQWIDSDISSGELVHIYANVSDENINTVWVSINSSTQVNITMSNTSSITFNASWIATGEGNYSFKVYANDTVGNLNNTIAWQNFTIRKPNATSQNETSPASALPLSLIRISSIFNSTDALRGIYANLNTPEGFVFISNYSQNLSLGNFTANEQKTAIWIVSVPLSQSNYTLNVTYRDMYGNSFNSSNFYVNVASSLGGSGNTSVYFVTVWGYPEVQTSNNYYAESAFTLNGEYSTPDTIKISLYDPSGNLIVSPLDMSLKQTGVYNYTYAVPSSQTTGQWETKINATKNSTNYYANQFWKLVGALFDLGSITIINSSVNNLNISVKATNVGNTTTDLTLSWNLTRVDNDAVLGSGGETFAVGATPVTKYYSPNISYAGNVKITFLGRYSTTETAGAYSIFTTTPANIICGDGTCNGGETCSSCTSDCGQCPAAGTGGGGGAEIKKGKTADFTIKVDKNITLTKNLEKTIYLEINNTGSIDLREVSLKLESLPDEFYMIDPYKMLSIRVGETRKFRVRFIVKNFAGEQNFNFTVSAGSLIKKEPARIIIINMKDYFLLEISRLRGRIWELENKNLINESKACKDMINKIEEDIENEEFINANDNIKNTDDCIDKIEEKIQKESPGHEGTKISWLPILIWILIAMVIAIISFTVYKFYRKIKIVDFIKNKEIAVPQVVAATTSQENFTDRLNRIKEKLGK